MDFAAQEMRVIADYSRDENLLACYIGDVRKDMHTLTGLGILNSEGVDWTYEEFEERLNNEKHPDYKKAKAARALGKKLNFTAEYGAAAAKVAATLMITEEEAQRYLDAREANFAKVQEWKQETIAEANGTGIVRTKLGAVRHLKAAVMSSDRSISSKAERQAVNTKVQGSSAEMTKLAEGRMWEARLEQRFDAQIIGPVHDEVIASCTVADLVPFCRAMHACMIAPYADMFVPIESSISFGPSFGEQHEIGNLPTEEAIKAGLQACGYTA
jgi:DNA polymerase I-like protein with 3'-5' exonuclease and polymerase domains